jgi:WD40 repeat protein
MNACRALLVLPLLPLVAAAQDKPVPVLDVGEHTARVNRVLFRPPDGKEVITVSDDKTIRVWDAQTGQPLRVLRPRRGQANQGRLRAAAVSPDGSLLAMAGTEQFRGKKLTFPIFLISLTQGQMVRVLEGHSATLLALAFSADGKRLASAGLDTTVRVWDVGNGDCTQVLKGHKADINQVAFSPRGPLASASEDGTARIWYVKAGKSAVLNHLRPGFPLERSRVRGLAWSPDGKALATCSNFHHLWVWEASGRERTWFRGPVRDVEHAYDSEYRSVAFPSDGRLMVFWGDARGGRESNHGLVSVVDPRKPRKPFTFPGHEHRVPPHRGYHPLNHGSVAPDGKLAATTGGLYNETCLWDLDKGTLKRRLGGRGQPLDGAAWGLKGQTVAWGSREERYGYHQHQAPAGFVQRAFNLAALRPSRQHDLSRYFGALRNDGPLSLHVTAKGDGREVPLNQHVPVVFVRQGAKVIHTLHMPRHAGSARCFTFAGKGQVAVGTNNGLFLYDASTGQKIRDLVGHEGAVRNLAVSADRRYLLSVSDDQTVRVWNPAQGEPLVSLLARGADWVAWTPQGYYAASLGGERLLAWHIDNGPDALASAASSGQFRKVLYRPDVIRRLLRHGSVDKALAAARGTPRSIDSLLPPRVLSFRVVKRNGPDLEVEAVVQKRGEAPVTSLRLLLDRRPHGGPEAILRQPAEKDGKATGTWKVTLPPGNERHRLSVHVRTRASWFTSNEMEVRNDRAGPPARDRKTLHVLAVGINDYPGGGIEKLISAVRDAQRVARTFAEHSKSLYTVRAEALTDPKQTTRAALLAALDRLRKDLKPADVAVLYLAAQGYKDASGKFYLLPVDANLKDLPKTALSEDELAGKLGALPARNVVVLLDACYPGSSGAHDLGRRLKDDDCGAVVLCSAREYEKALVHRNGYGFFTLALTEAVAGRMGKRPRTGVVQLRHVVEHVIAEVEVKSEGQQRPVSDRQPYGPPLAKP